MDPRARIPAAALIGLQFTTACEPDDDPIVGTWAATRIGEQELPIDVMEEGSRVLLEYELRIGADLDGYYWVHQELGGGGYMYYADYSYDLAVTASVAGEYLLEFRRTDGPGVGEEPGGTALNCALIGDQLDCSDLKRPGESIQWRRKG